MNTLFMLAGDYYRFLIKIQYLFLEKRVLFWYMKKTKKILILGCGFGGVYAYKSFSAQVHAEYEIIIVDKNNYFLFTPLLHEVATGSLGDTQIVEPIRSFLKKDTKFIQAKVQGINTQKQEVDIGQTILHYDILICALGSKNNYFNIPGACEYSLPLKTMDDAKNLKKHFIAQFEKASQERNQEKRNSLLSCVIVGGGPTGVELAGETADLFSDILKRYYPHLQHESSLILIDSSHSLLGSFPEKAQKYAEKKLQEKGFVLKKNRRVVSVKNNHITLDSKEILKASTFIWAAGVKAQNIEGLSYLLTDHKQRLSVNHYLQLEAHKNIFVIGDMSFLKNNQERPYSMTAQVAKQQGKLVGSNISHYVNNKKLDTFLYKEKGMLVSLGNYDAIAYIHGFFLRGIFAWFVWRTIYLMNFISWTKRLRIVFDWTLNLFTKRDISSL